MKKNQEEPLLTESLGNTIFKEKYTKKEGCREGNIIDKLRNGGLIDRLRTLIS